MTFDYLDPTDGTIVPGLAWAEQLIGEARTDVAALRVIVSKNASPDQKIMSRWRLNPDQRLQIANGAEIFVEILVGPRGGFGGVRVAVSTDPPLDEIRHEYGL